MNLRLDRYLADAGCGTRSQVKKEIARGAVYVNGTAEKRPERKVDPETDRVEWNGRLLSYAEHEYYMMNKPGGTVSATEDRRERTVLDLMGPDRRDGLFPVGRLDKDTVGLLLITDDGDLAHRLLSPRRHVDKVYYVRVRGRLTEEDVTRFREGLDIGDEKPALPADLRILKTWGTDPGSPEAPPEERSEAEVTLREGRFHQVKRMFRAVGKEVVFLQRISMGPLRLDESLAPGEYRRLTAEELNELKGRALGPGETGRK